MAKQPSKQTQNLVLLTIRDYPNATVEMLHRRLGYCMALGTVRRACVLLQEAGSITDIPGLGSLPTPSGNAVDVSLTDRKAVEDNLKTHGLPATAYQICLQMNGKVDIKIVQAILAEKCAADTMHRETIITYHDGPR